VYFKTNQIAAKEASVNHIYLLRCHQ